MARRPFIGFAACWLAGVASGSVGGPKEAMLFVAGVLLFVVSAALCRAWPGKAAAVCALALLAGAFLRQWHEAGQVSTISKWWETLLPAEVTLTGTVHSGVEVDGDSARFVLLVREVRIGGAGDEPASDEAGPDALSVREKVQVRVRLAEEREVSRARRLERGDAVAVRGTLDRPNDAGNFGAFDYRAYLARRGIWWLLSARGWDAVDRLPGRPAWSVAILRWTDRIRAETGKLMERLYPGGDAGYMKGLVAGIQDDVDPELYDIFSRLGLTHVLAISGMHVGIVAMLMLKLGQWLRLTRERSYDLSIAVMPAYVLFTGASPSAVRAGIMAMLALWLARQRRMGDGLHLLAAASVAMTAWQPDLVENLSFLLSVVVTCGLLLFVPPLQEWLPGPKWLRGTLAVTLAAQAASFPLTAHLFHQFHLLSPLANLLLATFIGAVVMPLGLASLVLGIVWPPLGTVPATLASWCNRATFALAEALERADGLRTVWPKTPSVWVVCGYALVGTTFWAAKTWMDRRREWNSPIHLSAAPGMAATVGAGLLSRQRRLAYAAAAAQALLWCGWLFWGGWRNPWDRTAAAMFLDVGQGDALLVRTGSGKHLMIDAGGTVYYRKPGDEWRERADPFDTGKDLLVPLLRQRGVRTLEALVLTHLDADHIVGAEAVLEEVRVKRLIINGTIRRDERVERLFRTALDMGVPVYAARSGLEWRIDESARLSVLHPRDGPNAGQPLPEVKDQNDASVVLLLELYGRRFLLPGDLGQRGERGILDALDALPERADVLKAGHHGSRSATGTLWLGVWRPRETVISVGRSNIYGHPHPDTLERLEKSGTAVFRTDRHGEIQYRAAPDGTLERRVKRP
jgi:competence protein ComEC